MRRRLNLRFLACLLGVGVVLGLGSHFLHGFQVRRNAEVLRQKAERAAEAGRIQEALGEYRRYLALVPTNGDAWGDYALLLERTARSLHERLDAVEKMDQALRLQPDRRDVRKRLVHVTMELGRYNDAWHHLDKLLEASPDDPELLHLRGRCLEGTGEYAAAAKQFEDVIRRDPTYIDSYIRLDDLYRHRLNRAADTGRLMDDLVKANGSPRAYVVRARYYRQGGAGAPEKPEDLPLAFLGAEVAAALATNSAGADPFAAARPAFTGRPSWAAFPAGDPYLLYKAGLDLAKARTDAPDDAEVLLESAELERSRGLLGPALRLARRGLEVHPDDLRVYLQVADLCALAGRRSEAINCLRSGMKALPDEPQLPLRLVELLIQDGQSEEATSLLAQLKKQGVEPAILDYLDGRRKAAREEWLEASQALEGAYPGLVRWPEMRRQAALLLGKCYEQLGDPDQQFGAYRRAYTEDRHDPLWFAAADGVARALLAMNKVDDAIEAYRRLIPHAPAARVVVARLLIVRNLGLPERQRHWDEVDTLLDEAVQLFPKSADLAILQAQALAARSKFDKAKAALGAAEAELPGDVRLSVARAGLAEAQGKNADALAILDDAEKRFGDHVELRLARIRHLLRTEDGDAVKSLGRLGEGLDHFSEADQQTLRRGLADAYAALNVPTPARKQWEEVARRKPNDLGVRVRLFDLALQMRDDDEAGRLVAEMRRLEGEKGTLWRYAAAARLVARAAPGDRKTLDEARPLLAEVAARRPGWHRVPVCEARIAELSGNTDLAISHYLQAIEKGERNPAVLLTTIRLLYQHPSPENYRKAYEVIRKLPEEAPLLQRMNQVAVDASLRANDTSRALALALKAVAENPDDYGNHLALGRVYWADKRLGDAEESLRRSVELKDDAPEPWVTLIDFLVRTERKADAEAALQKAEGKLSAGKHRLALAQCYAAVGQLDKAADLHRAALAADPNDPAVLQAATELALRTGRREDAKQYLRRLVALKDQSPGAATGARAVLALLAVGEGNDYQLTRETLTSLGFLNLPPEALAAESTEDKRARAVVLALQPGRGSREEAVRVLEEVAKVQPLAAADQFLLAQLYRSLGQWPKARSQMLGLLGKGEVDPVHVAAYARWLLERGGAAEAAPWVARLEQLHPKEWRTVELEARLLAAQQRGGDAADLLTKYAEGKDAPLAAVAALLEQLGQPKAAAPLYEKLEATAKKPGGTFLRAGFLARGGRLADALDLCDRVRRDVAPEVVAEAALELFDQGGADAAQLRRVEGWIDEALRAADRPATRAALQGRLATLYNLQGRYRESVDLYRRCLKQDGRDPVAANNLAWMLAVTGRDLEEALALIQRAIDRAGPRPDLLDTRAAVYLARGEAALAVKDLEAVVADRPSGPACFHLAQAQYAGKNTDAARDALRQALRLGLKEKDLHPLERDQVGRLRAALDVK
jgi:tetratricopeptide (TPR) repeat protein